MVSGGIMSEVAAPVAAAPSPQEQVLKIADGIMHSGAITLAAELGLPDLLADGPLHIDALAERSQTHSPSLFRVMRALESLGVFTQVSPYIFGNNALSECLRRKIPGSLWAYVMLASPRMVAARLWSGLLDSTRTGRVVFDGAKGESYFEYYQSDADKQVIFNEAMRSLPVTPAVTACLDWSQYALIADIGGGIGTQLADILNSLPSCRGILLDQPSVVANAIPHDRIQSIGGSFFEGVPPSANAYLLRFVIHDWNDEKAGIILQNVHRAMKPESRLMVIESVLPDGPGYSHFKWVDLIMLTGLGGRERSVSEYRDLLAKFGFNLDEIVQTTSPASVLVARKAD